MVVVTGRGGEAGGGPRDLTMMMTMREVYTTPPTMFTVIPLPDCVLVPFGSFFKFLIVLHMGQVFH